MRVLAPTVTVLVMSHMKPFLAEALNSLQNQTRTDFEAVIVDSGQWIGKTDERSLQMAEVYKTYKDFPLFSFYFTGESPEMHTTICPVTHWSNVAIENGLIRGKYMCTFYDDDVYDPHFLEKMAGYLDSHPECPAVWCSEARTQIFSDGTRKQIGVITASAPRSGQTFDCAVDGMQMMWRTELLEKMEKPWFSESLEECSHSDGVFFNKLATLISQVDNIPDILCEHRHTPISNYTPTT